MKHGILTTRRYNVPCNSFVIVGLSFMSLNNQWCVWAEPCIDITRVRSNPSTTAMIITHLGIRSNCEARMGLNKTRLARFLKSFMQHHQISTCIMTNVDTQKIIFEL